MKIRNSKFEIRNSGSGQTLIETVIAIFILVTALSAALGVVIYALGTASVSKDQIVALNLAREGVEVVRAMRDTNWLAADDSSTTSDNLDFCDDDDLPDYISCYPRAFDGPSFDLDNSGGQDRYRVEFNPTPTVPFRFNVLGTAGGARNFLLCLQPDGSYRHNTLASPSACNNSSNAKYARRVRISENDDFPFTDDNPEKIIRSYVVWKGKGCPNFTQTVDPRDFETNCKVVIEERLSNWKDYK